MPKPDAFWVNVAPAFVSSCVFDILLDYNAQKQSKLNVGLLILFPCNMLKGAATWYLFSENNKDGQVSGKKIST